MSHVSASIELSAPADEVWALVGSFQGLAAWHPAVRSSALESDGAHRRVVLADGAELLERLDSHDEAARTYSYAIAESPLPLRNYVSTLRVSEQAGGSRVDWTCSFDTDGPAEEIEATLQAVYRAGLDNLRELLSR